MAIPKPVLSDSDIVEVRSSSFESASLIWNTWGQDPIKVAVLQAILPKVGVSGHFRAVISVALCQIRVGFLH
jgi:hypothetical protein